MFRIFLFKKDKRICIIKVKVVVQMKRIKDYMIEKIEASKPQLIEAFTHVYGQSHYDFINDRINTTKVCICHDSVDIVDLLRMEHHVKKNGLEDKEKLLESIDFMIKCRRM